MTSAQASVHVFRSCKAPDCPNNTTNRRDLNFFPFPSDKDRCQVWLALSGRHDLINEPHDLMQFHVLCADHFEPDQFEDDNRAMLIDSAVPTIFPFSTSPQPPSSPVDSVAIKEEISDYDPDQQVCGSEDSVQFESPSAAEEVPAVVLNPPGVAVKQTTMAVAAPSPTVLSAGKPITVTTADGQKRILMAVPKEMYKSAVKSGKFSVAKMSGNPPDLQTLPHVRVGSSNNTNIVARSNEKRKATDNVNSEGSKKIKASVKKPSSLVSYSSSKTPLATSSAANLAKSTEVYQVAPDLPIPAHKEVVSSFNWSTLMPSGWQDWPVPLSVFLPAAIQLKANYLKLFPRRDRLDIETTLHLAAHYQVLSSDSKAHVRARVHHFLKIMQLELNKLTSNAQE